MKLLPIAILCAAALPALADDWTTADAVREEVFLGTLAVDWSQTRSFLRKQPAFHVQYYETNPLLGPHPSNDKLTIVVLSEAISHIIIARALPEDWRKAFQVGSIVVEAGYINHNRMIGAKVKF